MKKVLIILSVLIAAFAANAQNTIIINGGINTVTQNNSERVYNPRPVKRCIELSAGVIAGGMYTIREAVIFENYFFPIEHQWKINIGGYIKFFECMLSFSNGFGGVYCGHKDKNFSVGLFIGGKQYGNVLLDRSFGVYGRFNLCKHISVMAEWTTYNYLGVGMTLQL